MAPAKALTVCDDVIEPIDASPPTLSINLLQKGTPTAGWASFFCLSNNRREQTHSMSNAALMPNLQKAPGNDPVRCDMVNLR
jgi:hypothetical protein